MSLEPVNVECQQTKVEWEEETDGQQECEVHIKEEPEWTGGLTSSAQCVVKEESGLLDLYAGHKVEEDLVLGPEGPQLPDSAFVQPTCASSFLPSQVEPAEEPNSSVALEQSAGHDVDRHSRGSGKRKPHNKIQMKRSTASSSFDEQLKVCSVDKPDASLQFPPNSSLTIKPHSCDVCIKQFRHQKDLIRHKRTHTGEKLYSCDMCIKQFRRKFNLVVHIQTHTGEKRYSCDVCMKRFMQKCHLVMHIQTHTGEKRYSCDVCMKRFAKRSNLIRHKQTHTGEKPYSCDMCLKQFTQSSILIRHKRTHTGEKPYPCDICMKQFTQSYSLIRHKHDKYTHSGKRAYVCDMCMKQFTRKSSLGGHIRTQHTQKRNLVVKQFAD